MTDLLEPWAVELTPLIMHLQDRGRAESAMRLRALAEIAENLDTEQLLRLAAGLRPPLRNLRPSYVNLRFRW